MKLFIRPVIILSLLSTLHIIACKKELSCENCKDGNKPPIANAGADQTITLPKDSLILDGTASTDPDGTITSYKWSKIAGPVPSNITKPDSSKTLAKTLVAGVYKFELTVTDNGGLSAKDTVQIMVDAPGNQPPVACAGADQTITLPADNVNLNGSCSVDPDNNITAYLWTKISGPSSLNVANANAVQTQVTGLGQGDYQFELKVTDAAGLFSKDTVQVRVNSASSCDISSRQEINVNLVQIAMLSEPRSFAAVASAGNKILFAGGNSSVNSVSSRVDIFDISTNSWSTASLAEPRTYIATAILGNKIFFAGGHTVNAGGSSSVVDVYDAVANTWSTIRLPSPRMKISAGAVGNKVFFAGGMGGRGEYYTGVDIYDVVANSWSTTPLTNWPPEASLGIATTVIANKIYFAGASGDWPGWDYGNHSSIINIYDASADRWSVSSLSETKGSMAAIAVGTKNYWAGGKLAAQPPNQYLSNQVEIRDMNTGTSSFACLSQPNAGFFASFDAVSTNNNIVFFTGAAPVKNKFDIYNITSNSWTIGLLAASIENAAIVSVNNTIYVAGGTVNGVLSDRVWKLEL